ncbi:N-acetylneuraminic acid synthetase [Pseudorhizobium banfieldiae]|uniref:N-acetylneuraminic acid synthetase n=1 Tax=Pseudorhizobium banfieldiae TaxID=1125847 RepID=L0NJ02_9HYPH|nr:N-acetylneuraminate synthase [Pseudorhizobium banfieldiae]CAD6617780.1 N-acetylneuraminate synthase [arsenite-oxidising bacterium NT-25]CCF20864.1 N-acetylneuraminic acid synthetase [Pseudorhizobium banfieldiae]
MKTFVIAEIGVNHNGSLDLALKLVDAAATAGAQAAKFQTFKADTITARNTATVAYQKVAGGDDQHTMLKKLELSDEDHHKIAAHCADRGIEFMSTAFDSASLDLLCTIGIRRIKVPSGEVTNIPYLQDCARRGLPVILSTGMADLREVRAAVQTLHEAMPAHLPKDPGGLPRLVVLHCTSAYPTALDDVNLRAMATMAAELGVPVGYSDHTQGILVPPIAVASGALVIEKHVTLDRTMAGPDHAASLEPNELRAMIDSIATVEAIMGDGHKVPRAAELEARSLVRRGVKAARDLEAGEVLGMEDCVLLRPATGISPADFSRLPGMRLSRSVKMGEPLDWSMLD